MNDCKVVFCSDSRGLPGLHVAAYSLLRRIPQDAPTLHFVVLTNDLNANDQELLSSTLRRCNRSFTLKFIQVDVNQFTDLPKLMGSTAAYFRLLAPELLDADRLLYLDIDTLCDVDVTPLWTVDLQECPAAWVPEARMRTACDRVAALATGNREDDHYFNSGVMLIHVHQWRTQRITSRVLDFLNSNQVEYHDQTGLNVILHRNSIALEPRFNCMSNMRCNWPILKRGVGNMNAIVHFIDSPKPWDLFGEFVHPNTALWRQVLRETAISNYLSFAGQYRRRWSVFPGGLYGYKRSLKDKLLFLGYRYGLLKSVKGVPKENEPPVSTS